MEKEKRTAVIRLRVTKGMKRAIELAARRKNQSVSEWIRLHLAEAAWDEAIDD